MEWETKLNIAYSKVDEMKEEQTRCGYIFYNKDNKLKQWNTRHNYNCICIITYKNHPLINNEPNKIDFKWLTRFEYIS